MLYHFKRSRSELHQRVETLQGTSGPSVHLLHLLLLLLSHRPVDDHKNKGDFAGTFTLMRLKKSTKQARLCLLAVNKTPVDVVACTGAEEGGRALTVPLNPLTETWKAMLIDEFSPVSDHFTRHTVCLCDKLALGAGSSLMSS